jgi:hypothetical protein
MGNPCLHEAGFPVKSTTTSSLVVEYPPAGSQGPTLLWFTGSPYPCLSVFTPILLAEGNFIPLGTVFDFAEDSPASKGRWERSRKRGRQLGGAARSALPAFREARDAAQARIRAAALAAAASPHDAGTLAASGAAVDEALAEWEAFVGKEK